MGWLRLVSILAGWPSFGPQGELAVRVMRARGWGSAPILGCAGSPPPTHPRLTHPFPLQVIPISNYIGNSVSCIAAKTTPVLGALLNGGLECLVELIV